MHLQLQGISSGRSVSPLLLMPEWCGKTWGLMGSLPFAVPGMCSGIAEAPWLSSSSSAILSDTGNFSPGPAWRIWCTILSTGERSSVMRAAEKPEALMAATLRLVSHLRSDHFFTISMTSLWHSLISLIRAVRAAHVRFLTSLETPWLNLPVWRTYIHGTVFVMHGDGHGSIRTPKTSKMVKKCHWRLTRFKNE